MRLIVESEEPSRAKVGVDPSLSRRVLNILDIAKCRVNGDYYQSDALREISKYTCAENSACAIMERRIEVFTSKSEAVEEV